MTRVKSIRVAKPPKSAFNPGRPASSLLLAQIAQLETVKQTSNEGRQLAGSASAVRTEGQAAEYVARLTRLLHPEGAPPAPLPRRTKARRRTPRKTRHVVKRRRPIRRRAIKRGKAKK